MTGVFWMKVVLTESLKKAVMSKDIAAVRSAILTEVRNDRMREDPRALRLADLASKELPGLYEPDNGFCSSPGDLDISDDLWTKARAAMMLNFSRERLCFIETIVRGLHTSGNKPPSPSDARRPVATEKTKSRKFVALCTSLCVGIIVICLVVAGLKNRKNLQSADGIVNGQVKACPVESHAQCQCTTDSLSVHSTNTTCRANNGKDAR